MRYAAISITYSRADTPKLTQCDLIRQFRDSEFWQPGARLPVVTATIVQSSSNWVCQVVFARRRTDYLQFLPNLNLP